MNELFKNDRSFDDDVIKQQNMFVAEHNDLITKADHNLSASELKVMDLVISKIKPTDDDFYEVHTSLYEISKVFGLKRSGKTYNNIANALRSLRAKEVLIYSKTVVLSRLHDGLSEQKSKKMDKLKFESMRILHPFF